MENNANIFVEFLGICLVAVILISLAIKYILTVYMPFVEERDFIKMEIARSHGNSRVHWQHELRRLYLAQIPLIGGMLAEANKRREVKKREKNNSL